MKTYTMEELNEILRKHKLWLTGAPSGIRADLYEANLSGANLYGANLYGANLYGANLSRADLSEANLSEANLSEANLSEANLSEANLIGTNLYGANLSRANLSEADLSEANLYGANLSRADLSRADLSEANLIGTNNIYYPMTCPEKGSFTAFKKVRGDYIVELEIPADALRSSSTSRKCRCSHARVVSITNIDGSPANVDAVYSQHDSTFAYRVGGIVKPDSFDTNRWNECAPGIHFFITRQEAVNY